MEKVILVVHVISANSLVGIILLPKNPRGGLLSGLGGGGDPSAGVFRLKAQQMHLQELLLYWL